MLFTTRRLGALAFLFWAAHAADILVHHSAANLLWSCNVASLIVALGLLAERPLPTAAGGLMLILGDPLWVIDFSTGGELMVTAPLTHVGVLVLAIVGMRRLGMPRETFVACTLAIAAVTALARAVGPAADNVNLAFAVPPGWEKRFPSHGLYMVLLGGGLAIASLVVQAILRRMGFPAPTDGKSRYSPPPWTP
jgi:hypothetical protein